MIGFGLWEDPPGRTIEERFLNWVMTCYSGPQTELIWLPPAFS